MPRKVILLVNTGTPDGPDKISVKKYLSEFLNDPFVIDIPRILRKILVNFIIVPFRTGKSSELYSRLWTSEGSPLKVNLDNLTAKVQRKLTGNYFVTGAVRYGNPSVRSALKKVPAGSELIVLPLFPQYASATTGSVIAAVRAEAKNLGLTDVSFIDPFWSHPAFIDAWAVKVKSYRPQSFDHILFSYHSLPVSHIKKIHKDIEPGNCNCSIEFPSYGTLCYKAACYGTTRLIASKLGLGDSSYTTAFQSRMSKSWIGPFTDRVIKDLAAQGKKRILVVSPSFVSDCLETLIEIKEEYGNIFRSQGGDELVMTESLNHDDAWVNAVIEILGTGQEIK